MRVVLTTRFTLKVCLSILLTALCSGCGGGDEDSRSSSAPTVVSSQPSTQPGRSPITINGTGVGVESSPAVAETPGPWIDLLNDLDPATQAVAGNWRIENGELQVEAMQAARLALPWKATPEYDFEVDFTRTSGSDSIALIFVADPIRGQQASLELDAWSMHLAGIQKVDGKQLNEDVRLASDQRINNGQRYTVGLKVRNDHVAATLNGSPLTSIQRKSRTLSLVDLWKLPESTLLGLGAWNSDTTFHSVRVRPISRGTLMASPTPNPNPVAGNVIQSVSSSAADNGPPVAGVGGAGVTRPSPPVPVVSGTPSRGVPSTGATATELAATEAVTPIAIPVDAAGYREIVTPFMLKHCSGCHGPDLQEADFRVDTHLPNDFADRVAKEKWGEVVNVLNSHEMPPESEPQPRNDEVARVVDWITRQMAAAELSRRDSAIVLRRLNRDEYRNTVKELTGIDFDPSVFPQDPPTGGFDNNGGALTLSPLHLELYFDSARAILDRALIEGPQPGSIRWRFEPETGDSDSNRVTYDGQRAIVNGGKNQVERGYKVMHHASWDRTLNARDYALPIEGEYIIRIRAAGRVPTRQQVVESAAAFLADRRDREANKNPAGKKWLDEQYERDLAHFRTDRMYDYGPPRLKLIQNLLGQPRVIAELEIPATLEEPGIYEVRARFNAYKTGITIEYAYDIPRELENFWMQGHDNFARPELFVDWFEIEGPVYESWPPPSHQKILGNEPVSRGREREAAREVITRFMRRAYRRPVTDEEVDNKLALYESVRNSSPSFVEAIKTPLSAVMVSPHFLYLAEPVAESTDAANAGRTRPLNDHELASRLSYFLWSSMPDETLLELADAGRLQDDKTLLAETERMLADPKAEAFVQNFAGQWLGLRDIGANPPAQDLYPRYDRHLEISIAEESRAFFREILQKDLSVMNFVRSDFVVINERLGRFYGIPGVKGDHFRPVPVPVGVQRGGIITQASILTTTSNGTRTSPVKRGTWVLKNLMGIDPGLPVANAGEIAPKVPGIDKATVRQRLEIHRTLAQCARCHNKIDPLGFALENFNAAGEWRDREGFGYKGRVGDNDPEIDASSKLPDGTEVNGVAGLQEALMRDEPLFLKCLAGKMLTFALGRELGIADQLHVNAAVDAMRKDDMTLRSLIRFIVTSEPFQSK